MGWVGRGAQLRNTHLVRVEEERFEENSALKDLSPISIETTDKEVTDMTVGSPHNKQIGVNKQEMLITEGNRLTWCHECSSYTSAHCVLYLSFC